MICSKTKNEQQGFFHQPLWVTSPGPKPTGAKIPFPSFLPTPVPPHIPHFFETCETLEGVRYTLRAARVCVIGQSFVIVFSSDNSFS